MTESDNSLVLSVLKEIRSELRDQRSLLLVHGDALRRIDRRFDTIERRFDMIDERFRDLRDELELMLKAEAMGRSVHFETMYDEKLEKLRDRIAEIENALQPFDPALLNPALK